MGGTLVLGMRLRLWLVERGSSLFSALGENWRVRGEDSNDPIIFVTASSPVLGFWLLLAALGTAGHCSLTDREGITSYF